MMYAFNSKFKPLRDQGMGIATLSIARTTVRPSLGRRTEIIIWDATALFPNPPPVPTYCEKTSPEGRL